MRPKKPKRAKRSIKSNVQPGRRKVPDWALKRLVKNDRDYSYRHPTIENAHKDIANRTSEQQENIDWKNRPRIIYTPMGGQNKRY